jgi:hypothetical protein
LSRESLVRFVRDEMNASLETGAQMNADVFPRGEDRPGRAWARRSS